MSTRQIHIDNIAPCQEGDKRFNIITWITDALGERTFRFDSFPP